VRVLARDERSHEAGVVDWLGAFGIAGSGRLQCTDQNPHGTRGIHTVFSSAAAEIVSILFHVY